MAGEGILDLAGGVDAGRARLLIADLRGGVT